MNVRLLTAKVIFLVVMVSSYSSAKVSEPIYESKLCPIPKTGPGYLEAEQSFQDYVVCLYRDVDAIEGGALQIFRKNQLIHTQKGHKFQVGSIYEDEKKSSLIPMGKDITGDGEPDLVVSEWTGGAHCCFIFHVFQIGKGFRKIATIDAGHGDLSDFADLDGDSSLEFITADQTFAFWRTSFNYSPAPKVILRYRDGVYRVAGDLMRQPPPTVKELEIQAGKVREHKHWKEREPPSDLWRVMLDLIYTGHANLAWQFFEKAWKSGAPGKDVFLKDFRAQLAKSPYWPEVQAMNAK